MPVDLGRFEQSLVYSRRAPMDALLEDLAAIRAFDARQEAILKRWTIVAIAGLVIAILSFFLLPEKWRLADIPIRVPVITAGILAIIVGVTVRIVRSRLNLENRRYELAERVLRFLRRDTAPNAEITLNLDFRRPNHKAKYIRKGKVGSWDVKYFNDRWLRVGGRLLDGTIYRLGLIEKHQDRSKWARGRSGKLKHKAKTKSASELVLTLKVKSRRYPQLASLVPEARQAVKLPDWASVKAFRIDTSGNSGRSTLLLRSSARSAWTCAPAGQPEAETSGVRWFATMFLSLYQVLNLARAQTV